ncbi:MAG TPA: hypothetical protein VMP08_06765 [Anaerolineae bacterium]|nr:hypothetical protein [Anaerolineae bacterium]
MPTTMKFDPQGNLDLNWPSSDQDIIDLGAAFTAYEEQLLPAQQLKDLSNVFFKGLLQAAQVAAAEARAGEAARAQSAEVVRQAMEQARPLLDKIVLHLKSRHADNLAELEQWGLETKRNAHGVSVTKPNNDTTRRTFLLAYVNKEAALPVTEQITDPPLSQMQALADTLSQNRSDRTEQTTRRLRNVATRTNASQQLLDALQAAAAVLIVTRFNRQVTRDLQAWGFNVVAKATPGEKPVPPVEPAA